MKDPAGRGRSWLTLARYLLDSLADVGTDEPDLVRLVVVNGRLHALELWSEAQGLEGLFHLSTRQYARIVHHWAESAGLDSSAYGTHSMRRTKATLIYKRTKNLRAVQLLLGHSKLESTVRYLGIEVDDALEISEQTEV